MAVEGNCHSQLNPTLFPPSNLWQFPLTNALCAFFSERLTFPYQIGFLSVTVAEQERVFLHGRHAGISRSAEHQCLEKWLVKPPWASAGALTFNSGNCCAGP